MRISSTGEMDSNAAADNASNWFNVQDVPRSHVFPEEDRPGELPPVCHTLPVIDLGKPVEADTVQHIMKASREFGFFQVSYLLSTYKLLILLGCILVIFKLWLMLVKLECVICDSI